MPRRTNTRERLVATAEALFRRQGYAQTGVNEIMQQAKTTSGSFYHFFPTKDDLLLAVVDHVAEILETEVFGPAEELTSDPFERIIAVMEASRRHLAAHDFTLGSPLGSLAAEVSESHPAVRRRIAGLFEQWTERVRAYFGEAGDRLPAGVDRDGLARFALSIVEGAILQARVERNFAAFDASIFELQEHFRLLQLTGDLGRVRETRPRPATPSSAGTTDWRAW